MTEQQEEYTATTTYGNATVRVMPGDNDLREFFGVLRRALLMIVRWIEKRYPDSVA